MTREELVVGLQVRGYKAEPIETIKNGVVFEGVRIKNEENISPVIYTKHLLEETESLGRSCEEVVSEVISIYETNRKDKFDIRKILNADYVCSNLYIGIQRTSQEELVKRNGIFEGLEDYLYIMCDFEDEEKTTGTIKCTPALLEHIDISVYKAWEVAMNNTINASVMKNMISILNEKMNLEMEDNTFPMYVISNSSGEKGAASIYNKELLSAFAKMCNVNKIVVLPSSIHEMIILPYEEHMNIAELNEMVKEVNQSVVAEEERLTDRAYVIEV